MAKKLPQGEMIAPPIMYVPMQPYMSPYATSYPMPQQQPQTYTPV